MPPRVRITSHQRPNSLRLSQRDLDAMLAELDAGRPGSKSTSVRRCRRRQFRQLALPMEILQPGGTWSRFAVVSRNISRSGMALLHRAYVHVGVRCTVALPLTEGRVLNCPARVVRCQHIRGMVHEIGLCFDAPIELREVAALDLGSDWMAAERVEPRALCGTMLLIDPNAEDRSHLRELLGRTKIILTEADGPEAAMGLLASPFGIILTEFTFRGKGDEDLVRGLRACCPQTPVIVVTQNISEVTRRRLATLSSGVLLKPLDEATLHRALAEFLLPLPGAGEPRDVRGPKKKGGDVASDDQPTLEQLNLSGSFGRAAGTARAGFLPVPLERIPLAAVQRLPLYTRVRETANDESDFSLYRAPEVPFTATDRDRLLASGVRFVYLRMADQPVLRATSLSALPEIAADQATTAATRAAIVYDASIELVNEILADQNSPEMPAKLAKVSAALSYVVLNDRRAFAHLFSAAHHDFYAATHMVNVAAGMTCLAFNLGHNDPAFLAAVCQAGLLHDIGKQHIPEHVLNKRGRLHPDEWAIIREHPTRGCEQLARFPGLDPLVTTVTRQHHERLDGSGYPDGLKGQEIHPVSRMCGLVDSFDAMTAFRPFKTRTFSVAKAMEILEAETPTRYDSETFDAWKKLVSTVSELELGAGEATASGGADPGSEADRRQHERHPLHAPARVHPVVVSGTGWVEQPGMQVVMHSLSRSGMGFLSPAPVQIGEFVRVYLAGAGEKVFEGQTVRNRAYRDGWFEIGMAFAPLPTMSAAA
ncbi:MAG TPA: HD domain-containing phosphohydrolase [Phycisphaerales bacterium]|nr:HD domain-containing phosphohydrolase [Phycisphaerales bacterium]